ncbi:hypothetical protein [Lentzea roselyniae]|uniref:hypothetical protein n=1 Tax=Lentzea roselyniae TaxID=531940 RepID=UPI0031F9E248
MYDVKRFEKNQFYADDDDGGSGSAWRDLWFCFGKINEDPLFINRQDGTIWGFTDQGIV